MLDNSLHFSEVADKKISLEQKYGVQKGNYILATIHRNNNTDEPKRLTDLFDALNQISLKHKMEIVLPLHPRTAKLLAQNISKQVYEAVKSNHNFKIAEPASFVEMIALEKNANIVVTDSGGVQKEAFYFKKPCIIL